MIAISERELQEAVRDLARLTGWMLFHCYDARRSYPGFPDVTLVRGDHLIFAELKSETGRTTASQRQWLHALGDVRRTDTYLWRPAAWTDGVIEEILR